MSWVSLQIVAVVTCSLVLITFFQKQDVVDFNPSVESTRPMIPLTILSFCLHALHLPLLQHDAVHASLHQSVHTGHFPLKQAQSLRDLERDRAAGQIG